MGIPTFRDDFVPLLLRNSSFPCFSERMKKIPRERGRNFESFRRRFRGLMIDALEEIKIELLDEVESRFCSMERFKSKKVRILEEF